MTDTTSPQDRFREKTAETRSNLADMGHLAKEVVQEKLHDLRDRAGEGFRASKGKLHEVEESLARKVHEAPVKSLLVAVGIGVVASFLWRHR